MRWRKAKLARTEKAGEDKLRNPVEIEKEFAEVSVRLAPVAAEKGGADGNPFGYVRRSFFTAAPKALLEGASSIVYGGEAYRIDRVSEGVSGSVVTATRCKP